MTIFTLLRLGGWAAFIGFGLAGVAGGRRGLRFGLCGLSLAFAIFMSGTAVVETGTVGVRTTLGRVHDEVLEQGPAWVYPFVDSVIEMDTHMQNWAVDSPPCKSKDLQIVHATISVQHCLNGDMAAKAYQTVGDIKKFEATVIGPAVNEATKAVIGHYGVRDLIHDREKVKGEMVHAIQAFIDSSLEEKKVKGAVIIANVAIKNFDFSPQFNKSIEDTMTSQQEALQAESEAKIKIINAESAGTVRKLLAEAEAYTVNTKSIALADAVEREGQALAMGAAKILALRFVNTWSGQLPEVISNGAALTNVDKMINSAH